jgi:16S rRNA (uracil1498-N3)-methyltransferase
MTAEKNLVVAEITRSLKTATLKKPVVTLAVSLSKQSVMEIIAQKAVELGCDGLVPVVTKRSLYKKMSESKLARIRRIAHEASKQSGNASPMTVSEPVAPEGLPAADFKLLLWEGEKARTLKSALDHIGAPSALLLMVGPPGGFDADEVEEFKQNGFVTAGLGGLIQRTETAAISLMAVVNYHFGRI